MLVQFSEHTADPSFINGPQMVYQRERFFGQAARPGRKFRIKQSLASCSGHGNYADKRESLIAYNLRIADYDTGPHALLLMADHRIEANHNHCAAPEFQLRPSPARQPLPATHRIGLPRVASTSESASSTGKFRAHSSNP